MEKVKILVVEDDEQLMQTIESLLKLEGFEVHAATNGKIGFDQYMRCKPHLIVCDIMMPILSGLELFKKLQEEIENFATPFIFLTARAELQEIRQGMLLGADDYITKPFDNEDLVWAIKVRLEKIDRLVRQHGQNEEGNGLSLDWEKINMLTDREKDIIQEFCKGRSCSQIAKELILSEHTVQTHRKNIQRKLNVHSIYSIVSFAYKNNLA